MLTKRLMDYIFKNYGMFRKNLNDLGIHTEFTEFNNYLHSINPLEGLSRCILNLLWSPSHVGTVTRLCAQWCGVWFLAGTRIFSTFQNVQTGSGAHPASYSMGTWGFFLGDKQLGCEADRLTPPVNLMNGATPLLSLYAFKTCRGATLPYAACIQIPIICPPVSRPKWT
jgi:hypothetical protein